VNPTDRSWRYGFTDLDGQEFPRLARGGRKLDLQPQRIEIPCLWWREEGRGSEKVRVLRICCYGELVQNGRLLGKRHYLTLLPGSPLTPVWLRQLAERCERAAQAELDAVEAYKALGAG